MYEAIVNITKTPNIFTKISGIPNTILNPYKNPNVAMSNNQGVVSNKNAPKNFKPVIRCSCRVGKMKCAHQFMIK